jgi:HSP90 family molecular chaperone
MKLQDTNTTIAQIGTSQESQFKMKTSRKAFQILSDLYSDKPLAIVRELGCNASDSMVAAGKADKPFHIHLPNSLEPWITIQDYGTGISHENIYAIYATYFESTKTNTNDQIGCLGLGSKSPFCYSDNFVVTSIHEGIKSIYNAYFNEQNTPAIALMSKQETTEGNGIAIQIPVKADDFTNFQQAVQKAFRFFPVKPIISGGLSLIHI